MAKKEQKDKGEAKLPRRIRIFSRGPTSSVGRQSQSTGQEKQKQSPSPGKPNQKQGKYEVKMNINLRRMLLWLLILFLFVPFLISLFQLQGVEEEVPLSQVLSDIKEGKIEKVEILGENIRLEYKGEELVKLSRKEAGESFTEILVGAEIDPTSVEYTARDRSVGELLLGLLGTLLPLVLIGVFFLFLLRQARGAQDGIFSFGKSRAKLFSKGKQTISFKDVGGVKEAKEELEEVVDFLKHPRKYRKLGARTPKGVLLVGPSGTGKTLLARAVAGEAQVPFFSMAGSEFMEMLVGVGASRTRDLFNTAKKAAPSVIFIDEIDAIGRVRGGGFAGGGHGEQEQTLNQILVEMDGFSPNDNVMVLAATNRPELLDPALVRPGRFDRRVMLDLPDIEERKKIIAIHAKGKPFVKEKKQKGYVDWDKVTRRTVGFSGADLENMLNEAAIQAARNKKEVIDMDDIEESATKVKLGPEKKRLQSKLEKKMTAYHEGGHAVVGHLLARADPIHRVSIVSRGMTLGATEAVPKRDKYHHTKSELLDKMAVMLGGRSAEELIFDEMTGGAASDIEKVTRLARRMVVDLGMSELGPVSFGPVWETTEWGRSYLEPAQVSSRTKAKIDSEVKRLVDEAHEQARSLLKEHKQKLTRVAEQLVKVETIDGDEFERLMGVKKKTVKES